MNDTVVQDDARRRDVFVSHASEDKDAIARPLTDALIRRGFTVWFDEHELVPGDSLRRRIGQGLRDARIGVVILSRPFFAKEWTQWELDGLTARQMNGENNVIVPVWHGVDKADVAAHSPSLADLVAIPSELGVEAIVDGVARRLGRESVPSPSTLRSETRGRTGLDVRVEALNVTAGEQEYRAKIDALVDHVVQVQAHYVNRSADHVIRNLAARPTLPDHADRELPVPVVVSADGEALRAAAVVRASHDRAQLVLVSGSGVWRHRADPSGYRNEPLDDVSVVGAPFSLGNVAPGEAGA